MVNISKVVYLGKYSTQSTHMSAAQQTTNPFQLMQSQPQSFSQLQASRGPKLKVCVCSIYILPLVIVEMMVMMVSRRDLNHDGCLGFPTQRQF